ncbi:MAG: zf-HC2 domain-containing protein [candidate division Zixibacteria bacterium]|nr:zf-HC2 domain-containing protein [candidate division Zixibacteria bacterium]
MTIFKRLHWAVIQAIARRLPPCRAITHLLSESRDRKLSLRERITVRSHLVVCTWCTRFGHQIACLEEALGFAADQPERLVGAETGLADSARDRIRKHLQAGD